MSEQSIAHYQITSLLGQGGMGDVYRASDTKLQREVALKFLPDSFAQDPERVARFGREAQVLASLNHPNIAAIYGLEEHDGKRALVLELVEGETLAERIARGPVPLGEVLRIGRQIALALEEAHEHGIVHRDLKPANVKIAPDGTVKVLDFGLAKALEEERSGEDLANSPTLTLAATRAGVILGTAAYMSPEQARGQAVDRRSDVWSFGAVLLEMLTGKAVYSADTVSDTLARVLERDPDWTELPRDTPKGIERLLRRTLEKDFRHRLQAMGEARITLEEYLDDPVAAEAAFGSVSTTGPGSRPILPWIFAATATLALVVATLGWWRESRPVAGFNLNLRVDLAEQEPFNPVSGAAVVLSPDGRRLAYVLGTGRDTALYLRALDQLEGTRMSGTDGAYNAFFSPDGQWIAYFTIGQLKKVSISGGTPLSLCDSNFNRGGAWGPDDTIVFAQAPNSGLYRLPAAGGEPQPLTTLDQEGGEITHRWPQFLPGGKAVLFTAHTQPSGFDTANIKVIDLGSGEIKVVHEGGTYARYVPSGHIVYMKEGTVFAVPFDLGRLEVTGSPAPVLEGVTASQPSHGGAQFAFSQTGTLVYLKGLLERREYGMVWVDRNGRTTPVSDDQKTFMEPRFSPDGSRLAVEIDSGSNSDAWIYDLKRGVPTRLTFDDSQDYVPVWSPDGTMIAFSSTREGPDNLYWKRADGSGEVERLTESDNVQYLSDWSPDGKYIIFHEQTPSNNFDLWVLPIDGDRRPQIYLDTPFAELEGAFSPDGKWVAYQSDESGQDEIYVRPFPDPGGKWQISIGGGQYARWSRDGKELYYRTEDGVMAVAIDTRGGSLQADRPEELFDGTFLKLSGTADYDVHPDGQRFLLFQDKADRQSQTELILVTNWFDELRRTFAGSR